MKLTRTILLGMIVAFALAGCSILDFFLGAKTVAVTGVSVKSSTTLEIGGTEQLFATVFPSNAANKKVSWQSANPGVVAVDSSGLVTGIAAGGPVNVTATTRDGGFTANCAVTVAAQAVSVGSISLNKSTTTLNAGGSGEQLVVTITPSGATNQNINWTSSDTSVATVSTGGDITPLAAGTTIVTASSVDGGMIDTCVVTVVVPVTGVSLDLTTATIGDSGSLQLTATVAPADATDKAVTWASSNDAIATVDQSGLVYAVALGGPVTITVTTHDGSKTATCAVTVKNLVTGVTMSPTTASVTVSMTTQLAATIAPPNATDQVLTWTSSNSGIATVSASGLVAGVAAGPATITATTHDGGYHADCDVTVTAGTTMTQTGTIYDGQTARPISGATIHFGSSTATTAANGSYSITTTSASNTADFGVVASGYTTIMMAAAPLSPTVQPPLDLRMQRVGAPGTTHTVTGRIYVSGMTEIADITSSDLSIQVWTNGCLYLDDSNSYLTASGGYSIETPLYADDCMVLARMGQGPNYNWALATGIDLTGSTTSVDLTMAPTITVSIANGVSGDSVGPTFVSPYGNVGGKYINLTGTAGTYTFINPNGWQVLWSVSRTYLADPTAQAFTSITQYTDLLPSPADQSTVTLPDIDTSLKFTSAPGTAPNVTYSGGVLELEPVGGASSYYAMVQGSSQNANIFGFSNSLTLPAWLQSLLSGQTADLTYIPVRFSAAFPLVLGALGLIGGSQPNTGMAQIGPTGGSFYSVSNLTFP